MVSFRTHEHILQESFGHFKGRTTLTDDEVCDACNKLFGETIDLELARNTLDGFARYQVGIKTGHFDPPTKDGYLRFYLADGLYAGARASQKWMGDGLVASPMKQIGIAKQIEGPYSWFEPDGVPKAVDARELLLPTGEGVFRIEGFSDIEPVLERLRQLGYGIKGEPVAGEPIMKDRVRIEVVCRLGPNFGRALAKIAMNYVAAYFGPEMIRRKGFASARKFVHHGARYPGVPQWRGVSAEEYWIKTPHERGHVVGAASMKGQVVAEIGFEGAPMRWQVNLTTGAPGIAAILPEGYQVPLVGAGAHFYNRETKSVEELGISAWSFPGLRIEYLEGAEFGPRRSGPPR
jgi:hypothetical protein